MTEGDAVVFAVHTDKVAMHSRRPLTVDVLVAETSADMVAAGDEWSNEGRWS